MLQTSNSAAPRTTEVRLPARHSGQRKAHRITKDKRFVLMPCGRGWGKTIDAIRELGDGVLKGQEWHFGAPDYDRVTQVYNALLKALAPIVTKQSYGRRLDFATGGFVKFWTLRNLTAGQGYHPNGGWIIDEAGLVSDLVQIWTESIRPSLNRHKARALFRGTPKGQNGFYQLWTTTQDDPDWGHYTATSYDNPYIDPTEIDKSRKDMTDARYRQEILAEFLEDGAGVFRYVKRAVYGPMLTLAELAAAPGHYAIGADLGKVNDFTVFAVLNLDTGRIVHIWRMQGDYTVQLPRLRALAESCRAQSIIIESNIEQMFTEQARAIGLPVLSFNTNASTKQPLIERLAIAFEQETISIPDDAVLVSELMAYEGERRADGHMSYSAPEGQHDDTVMAVALAWWAKRTVREWGTRSIYE